LQRSKWPKSRINGRQLQKLELGVPVLAGTQVRKCHKASFQKKKGACPGPNTSSETEPARKFTPPDLAKPSILKKQRSSFKTNPE